MEPAIERVMAEEREETALRKAEMEVNKAQVGWMSMRMMVWWRPRGVGAQAHARVECVSLDSILPLAFVLGAHKQTSHRHLAHAHAHRTCWTMRPRSSAAPRALGSRQKRRSDPQPQLPQRGSLAVQQVHEGQRAGVVDWQLWRRHTPGWSRPLIARCSRAESLLVRCPWPTAIIIHRREQQGQSGC